MATVANPSELPVENKARTFYSSVDREKFYAVYDKAEQHPLFEVLTMFIKKHDLYDKRCLEIGSGKGIFQDVVVDYTGVDIGAGLSAYYHKPYFLADGALLPFEEASFDGVFSIATHEHIPELEVALNEMIRVLKPGGYCLFAPAWQTRPWFADGLAVRPYANLTNAQRLQKLIIPIRDAKVVSWSSALLRRLRELTRCYFEGSEVTRLRYVKLRANYETYWQSDSDACNSIDQFSVILWLRSRGMFCHGYESIFRALIARPLALEFRKAQA